MNVWVKINKGLLGLLLCFALFACAEDEERITTVTISSVAPTVSDEVSYQDLEGNSVSLADFLGRRVFVNYWATWCVPCIKEIPSIARAEAILAEEDFVFLLVSDESVKDIAEFVAERSFDGRFIKLNSFFGSVGIEAVPSSFLFDANGVQVGAWLGDREWDSEGMLAELRGL